MSIEIKCSCGEIHNIFTITETAEIVGCEDSTVKKILARLKKKRFNRDWCIPESWIPEIMAEFKGKAGRPWARR